MKARQIGDIQFWNEMVVHYRNMRDKSQTDGEFIENLEMLKVSREELKEAEKKYLGNAAVESLIVKVTLVFITFLIFLTIVGCQTVKGVTGDAGWILTKVSDNIQVQEK